MFMGAKTLWLQPFFECQGGWDYRLINTYQVDAAIRVQECYFYLGKLHWPSLRF